MTDRELLELAAKAAGIEGEHFQGPDDTWRFYEPYRKSWNPLTDDGDALRLAVRLRLEIDIHHTGIAVRTPNGIKVLVGAEDEPDANAATRRAIVRAAAEIGRAACTIPLPPLPVPADYQILVLGERWTHCTRMIHDAAAKRDPSTARVLHTADQLREAQREAMRVALEAAARECEARQTPGTGSVAILNGAADAIRNLEIGT